MSLLSYFYSNNNFSKYGKDSFIFDKFERLNPYNISIKTLLLEQVLNKAKYLVIEIRK
jgi:hypothetical protein